MVVMKTKLQERLLEEEKKIPLKKNQQTQARSNRSRRKRHRDTCPSPELKHGKQRRDKTRADLAENRWATLAR